MNIDGFLKLNIPWALCFKDFKQKIKDIKNKGSVKMISERPIQQPGSEHYSNQIEWAKHL